MQLLAGANLIEVDFSLKDDRALFGGAQKRGSLTENRLDTQLVLNPLLPFSQSSPS